MTLETTDSEPSAPTPPLPTPSPPPDFEWSDKLALERIEAITRNARATWFGLLGLLAFVMVTLLGVEDIDFFGYDRDTALPLVGVAVPTITFFVAAPILAAAVYAYFHFYLMKLWDALGRAPARVFNDPIGDLIHPWLLSDAALVLRDNLQIRDDDKAIRQKRMADEGAAAIRPLRWVSALTSAALTWVAGWVTLGYAWVISWPAHEEWLSLLIFGCFLFTLWTGAASLWAIWVRVGRRDFAPEAAKFWQGRRRKAAVSLIAILGCVMTWNKTEGGLEGYLTPWAIQISDWRLGDKALENETEDIREARHDTALPRWLTTRVLGKDDPDTPHFDESVRALADFVEPAFLFEAQLVEKPADWTDREVAEQDFRRQWCDRRDMDWALCVKAPDTRQTTARHRWCHRGKAIGAARDNPACDAWFAGEETEFQLEWATRRTDYLSILRKPNMEKRDLRGANLVRAFLVGVDFEAARLEGAYLRLARLEGANLRQARLEGASLWQARLEGADLSWARLEGANLTGARLEGANLTGARLEGANLWQARLEGADLSWARLEEANLRQARLEGADLTLARLEGVDLRLARFQSAEFSGATIGPSPLNWADFTGARGVTQEMLKDAVGNGDTILPVADGKPLYVWSCWEEPPATFGRLLGHYHESRHDDLRAEWICGPEGRKKTGRTAEP